MFVHIYINTIKFFNSIHLKNLTNLHRTCILLIRSGQPDSNKWPADLQSAALPTELCPVEFTVWFLMICLRDKDTDINPCKELVRNLLCKSMLSTTTYLFFTIIDKSFCFLLFPNLVFCTTSFPRMLLIQQATYPFILIFSLTQQASLWGDYRRPHKEYQFKHLFRAINIIIVHLFFCGLSVDSWSSPLRPALYFHPYCFSQQYSHFHPMMNRVAMCLSLFT